MNDWNVRYEPPHHRGQGPFYVVDFYVSRGSSMAKPVLVKLTDRAATVVGAEVKRLTGRDFDFQMREQFIVRWGEEKIRELLSAGRPLPGEISVVAASGRGHAYPVTAVEVQIMLKRWGFLGAQP
jgi:hypothetical protein